MNKNMYKGLEYCKLFYTEIDGKYNLFIKLYFKDKKEILVNMSNNPIVVHKTQLEFIKENLNHIFIFIDDASVNEDEEYETHISLYYQKGDDKRYISNVNIPYWENLHGMNPIVKSIEKDL